MTLTAPHYRVDGFANQRLCVVPRPQVEQALARPVTRSLTVTDAGWFPAASGHRMRRAHGVQETIVLLCVSGGGFVSFAGETHVLSAGTGIVIPAGVTHEYRASDTAPWTIWWLHLAGGDLPELLRITRSTSASPVRTLSDVFTAVALISETITHLGRDTTTSSLLGASGAAWHLLALIAADHPPGDER